MSTTTIPGSPTRPTAIAPRSVERNSRNFCLSIPASTMSFAGFREWATSDKFPEDIQVAYLGGEIFIDMSPERLGIHNAAKSEINHVLYQLVRSLDLGRYMTDGMLVSNEAADLSNEPEGMFVSWETLRSGRAQFIATASEDDCREILGTPDAVVEVVSPSSERKDYEVLRERYHLAGIPEYWLVDGREDKLVFIIFRHQPLGYVEIDPVDGWLVSSVFNRKFMLERSRARDDNWQYTLHIAPLDPVV
ncbi:MAG TPA: Uma2 family endonuclease [Gemmataceae bacterium]|jgi:Uma2 family endonuclease|nr:Uma2 family endonuclease [Gemmataceae bacterium]